MKWPFSIIKNHPYRFGVWLMGFGSILDGLTSVLSLGFVCGNFSWIAIKWGWRLPVMSDTKKDKAKIMKKISRKQNPLPPEQVISPNKKAYKRKPKHKNTSA